MAAACAWSEANNVDITFANSADIILFILLTRNSHNSAKNCAIRHYWVWIIKNCTHQKLPFFTNIHAEILVFQPCIDWVFAIPLVLYYYGSKMSKQTSVSLLTAAKVLSGNAASQNWRYMAFCIQSTRMFLCEKKHNWHHQSMLIWRPSFSWSCMLLLSSSAVIVEEPFQGPKQSEMY